MDEKEVLANEVADMAVASSASCRGVFVLKSLEYEVTGDWLMDSVRKVITVVVALLYLVGATGGIAESVLCIGDDGHVAIERSREANCCADEAASARPVTVSLMQPVPVDREHCGACFDIPIISDDGRYASPKVKSWGTYLSHTATPTFAEFATVGLLPLPPPAANATLRSLRTVVLLI